MSTIHEEWHRALCQMLIHCRGDGGGQNTLKGKGLEMRRSVNGASVNMMIVWASNTLLKTNEDLSNAKKLNKSV